MPDFYGGICDFVYGWFGVKAFVKSFVRIGTLTYLLWYRNFVSVLCGCGENYFYALIVFLL